MPLIIPLDRLQAFVRAVWRAAGGSGLFWLGWFIWPGPDYDTIVYLSFLLCAVALVFTGVMISLAALRWLALSVWPRKIQAVVDATRIDLQAGPFGHAAFHWQDIDVALEGELDADIYEALPADGLVPALHDRSSGRDVFGILQTYSSRPAEQLASTLKPFVLTRMREAG